MVSSQMNILLSCAGRRNYMVDYFQSAVGGEGEVHVANNVQDLSSMAVCSRRALLPLIYDEHYIDSLLDYCIAHSIELIVPLFDLELPILAAHRLQFADAGITIAVSTEEVCAICLDKVRTHEFLQEVGLGPTPYYTTVDTALDAVEKGHSAFPLFVKPRVGMGSIGLHKANSSLQLRACFEMAEQEIESSYLQHESSAYDGHTVIIQGMLTGDEYGLDVVNDLEGQHACTIVKKKLGMRSGETDGAVTQHVPALEYLGRQIGEALGHRGNLDVDVFWDGEKAYVLEMNPRFGGGYPFSHQAGANLPAAYIAWAQGKSANPEWLTVEPDITSVKGISLHQIAQE